jgi:hypothetical protein
MPAKKRLAVLIAIAAIAAALTGCGSDEIKGTLTAEQAGRLNTDLNAVQQASDAGDCTTANSAIRRFRTDVFELPSEAGTDLKAALQDGGQQLSKLVAVRCGTASGATGAAGQQPTGSTPKEPTTPDTTSATGTTTTGTTSTPSPSEQPSSPAGGGNANGLGDGNAGGNGNGQANGNPGGGNQGGGSTGGGSTGGTGGTGVGSG